MASKHYKKVGQPKLDKGVHCKVDVDNLDDLGSREADMECASKDMLSNAGNHKGSMLYTKHDK